MGQQQRATSFLRVPDVDDVPEGVQRLWTKSKEAFGFIPNVFRAQALNGAQFEAWWKYFNLLVNKEGHLSNAERELIAVVVSGINRCTYCVVSHGAALREYSGDPVTSDLVAINWRQAELDERQTALTDRHFSPSWERRPGPQAHALAAEVIRRLSTLEPAPA